LSAGPLSLRPCRRIQQTAKLTISIGRTWQYFLGALIQDHLSIEITIVALAHHSLMVYARALLIGKVQIVMVIESVLLRCVRCCLISEVRDGVPTTTAASNILERSLYVV